jgi:hypothetical protein
MSNSWDHTAIDVLYDLHSPAEAIVKTRLDEYLSEYQGYSIDINSPGDRYEHRDLRVRSCKLSTPLLIEVESSTDSKWLQTPSSNWYCYSLLSRKCSNGGWDIFIKVSPASGYNAMWAITYEGLCLAYSKKMVTEKASNDSLHINTDHTKCQIDLSIERDKDFDRHFVKDDWAKLSSIIFDKIFREKEKRIG